jgi:AcrR family transcriptional regulator
LIQNTKKDEKMQHLPRRQREYLRHRQEILNAALNLFSEKGFHSVTMHEIASASEFAVGTLYKFFSNKDDLYKALILEKADEFHFALIEAIESGQDEMNSIRAYMETYIDLYMGNEKYVRLYFAETKGASFNIRAGLDEEIKEKHGQVIKKLANVFDRGIRQKLFVNHDPFLLATALEGVTHAFLVQHLDYSNEHPFDADTIIKMFFESLKRAKKES